MNGIRKKLRSKRGESLVEALVAIVLAALSILMLTSMISSSARLGAVTERSEDQLNSLHSQAEGMLVPVDGAPSTVTVSEADADYAVEVVLYGGPELYSYGEGAGG